MGGARQPNDQTRSHAGRASSHHRAEHAGERTGYARAELSSHNRGKSGGMADGGTHRLHRMRPDAV